MVCTSVFLFAYYLMDRKVEVGENFRLEFYPQTISWTDPLTWFFPFNCCQI